jgi:hypothetical protein
MAGQGVERREVLRMMAKAAAAAQFPDFSRWVFACSHQTGIALQIRPAKYEPRFFTVAEYDTLVRLTELIIPADGTPGAREAGVSEFIDFMVWNDPSIQYRFRTGLTWLNARSQVLHGAPFNSLDATQQSDLLQHLAYRKHYRSGEEDGRAFFSLVRDYTVMGFYTSRIGLEELDFPGLKMYSESPECPHTGDPEHKQLKKANA